MLLTQVPRISPMNFTFFLFQLALRLSNMTDIASYFRNIGQYKASEKVGLKIN